MTTLQRTRDFLSLLEEQLGGGGPECDAPPLVESVVVNYMLTVVYAEVETAVKNEVVEYCRTTTGSVRVNSFVQTAARKLIRSIKCSELAGVLGQFDDNCKRHFQAAINDTSDQAAYDRVVGGRHEQAHNLGSTMTLTEFKSNLAGCEVVLEAFSEALSCSCAHD